MAMQENKIQNMCAGFSGVMIQSDSINVQQISTNHVHDTEVRLAQKPYRCEVWVIQWQNAKVGERAGFF